MGYAEKIMADNEQALYRTHRHLIVLVLQAFGSFFAFLVFLGLGLTVLLSPYDEVGMKIRFVIGLIALGSLVMPLYLIIAPWMRSRRGHDSFSVKQIWPPALAGLFILAVALVMMIRPEFKVIGWIAVALALVPFAELIRHLLDWLNERYIITNRRVMEIKGIVNKHVRDSALEKVNDVDLKQSIVGRLLGYGTVQIITGSDIGINRFHRISNPVRFKREMLNAKEKLHVQLPQPAGPEPTSQTAELVAPGSAPSAEANIPDLIVELADLRQKGLLSEEEFQAKKQELLERL